MSGALTGSEQRVGTTTTAPNSHGYAPPGPDSDIVLRAKDVSVSYRRGSGGSFLAVDSVSLELRAGETLGLVGESGCGKSSMGRSIVQLPPPASGQIWLGDTELTALNTKQLRPLRSRIQLIFQDPISSLNPRRTAQQIVAEPLRLHGQADADKRALDVLAEVGVDFQMAQRRPHQLSGGQCQRVSIARALAQRPDVLICDEPVSALDVSVQARVLNLLQQLHLELNLSMVFISHDLAVVGNVSDRIAVMYLGRICEVAPTTALLEDHRHHYTKLLLDSVPKPGQPVQDHTPVNPGARRPIGPGVGCAFASRCPAATDICRTEVPKLTPVAVDHSMACHHPIERSAATAASAASPS